MLRSAVPTQLDWVDVAKGICIVLVVLMHATHGVEKAVGTTTWIDPFIAWARPFRLPDFFLISGLFLASRIKLPWRTYLDSRVLHFVYFYVLWMHVLLAIKAAGIISEQGIGGFAEIYLQSFIRPYGPIWFIYLLGVYCVATKLLQPVAKPLVMASAVVMHCLWPETGIFVLDEFANRFVFFYTGYALSQLIFGIAGRLGSIPTPVALGVLAVWAVANQWGVASGWAAVKGVDLVYSGVGIAAVIAASVLLVGTAGGHVLAFCGSRTIAIYLAFTIFMGASRVVLLKLGFGFVPEVVAIASTLAGIIGSLTLAMLVRGTRMGFLFERPGWFGLGQPDAVPVHAARRLREPRIVGMPRRLGRSQRIDRNGLVGPAMVVSGGDEQSLRSRRSGSGVCAPPRGSAPAGEIIGRGWTGPPRWA